MTTQPLLASHVAYQVALMDVAAAPIAAVADKSESPLIWFPQTVSGNEWCVPPSPAHEWAP